MEREKGSEESEMEREGEGEGEDGRERGRESWWCLINIHYVVLCSMVFIHVHCTMYYMYVQ